MLATMSTARYRHANRDQLRAKARAYHQANRDRIAVAKRETRILSRQQRQACGGGPRIRAANRDTIAARSREYRRAPRDEIRAHASRHYHADRAENAARAREYYRTHRDRIGEAARAEGEGPGALEGGLYAPAVRHIHTGGEAGALRPQGALAPRPAPYDRRV